jgi:hypothetical protein
MSAPASGLDGGGPLTAEPGTNRFRRGVLTGRPGKHLKVYTAIELG